MCVCSSWTVLVGSRPSVSLCRPIICLHACLSVYQPPVGPVVSGANGVADYHPPEVVALSPATLHLVTWIGLRFGLGPGRRSGPGLRLGLRCGLPYTANLARLTLTLTRTLTLTQTLTLTLTLIGPNEGCCPNPNPNPNPNSNPRWHLRLTRPPIRSGRSPRCRRRRRRRRRRR